MARLESPVLRSYKNKCQMGYYIDHKFQKPHFSKKSNKPNNFILKTKNTTKMVDINLTLMIGIICLACIWGKKKAYD